MTIKIEIHYRAWQLGLGRQKDCFVYKTLSLFRQMHCPIMARRAINKTIYAGIFPYGQAWTGSLPYIDYFPIGMLAASNIGGNRFTIEEIKNAAVYRDSPKKVFPGVEHFISDNKTGKELQLLLLKTLAGTGVAAPATI